MQDVLLLTCPCGQRNRAPVAVLSLIVMAELSIGAARGPNGEALDGSTKKVVRCGLCRRPFTDDEVKNRSHIVQE